MIKFINHNAVLYNSLYTELDLNQNRKYLKKGIDARQIIIDRRGG